MLPHSLRTLRELSDIEMVFMCLSLLNKLFALCPLYWPDTVCCSHSMDLGWAKWCFQTTQISTRVTMWHPGLDGKIIVSFLEAKGWKLLIQLPSLFPTMWAVLVHHSSSPSMWFTSVNYVYLTTSLQLYIAHVFANSCKLPFFQRWEYFVQRGKINSRKTNQIVMCPLVHRLKIHCAVNLFWRCRYAWLHSIRGTVWSSEAKERWNHLHICSFRSSWPIGGSACKASRPVRCG